MANDTSQLTEMTDSGFLKPVPSPVFDPQRAHRLAELGLGMTDPALDVFATRLAETAGVPYAMVNLVDHERQLFAGVHSDAAFPAVGRGMTLQEGWCPEVAYRRKSLVLPDVFVKPRFKSNPVVNGLVMLRTYAGSPLIDPDTDMVLGTVCFVGPEKLPKSTARSSFQLINATRDEVLDFILRRAGRAPQ